MVVQSRQPNAQHWAEALGLLPIPLFPLEPESPRYVLLNGSRGNFCLDLAQEEDSAGDPRSVAWSCNVGFYVTVRQDNAAIYRWDAPSSYLETHKYKVIAEDFQRFHSYLESASVRQEISIVRHSISLFRRLRSVLSQDAGGTTSLRAFLMLLACAASNTSREALDLPAWGLSAHAAAAAALVRDGDWAAIQEDLLGGRPTEDLSTILPLVLRHAAGDLFQEAHYEALVPPQTSLEGFLPPPVTLSGSALGSGVHFTPPSLARTLVEEGLAAIAPFPDPITIFDPACGSGEFLREAMRQLDLAGYIGAIRLIGQDISPAACDMARFALSAEARSIQRQPTIDIRCVDSLDPGAHWPQAVDLVVMNPPFVSWEDMAGDQRANLKNTLASLASGRADLSYPFIWRAASSLGPNGVLASILPASFLDSASALRLRQALGETLKPLLVARLGSHLLFSKSVVDAALLVSQAGAAPRRPPLAFVADHRSTSTSAGLRALRRLRTSRQSHDGPISGEGFSIYPNPDLAASPDSWAPRPFAAWSTLRRLEPLPKVREVFSVRQGSRTGMSKAFIVTVDDWRSLPRRERKYFRPAIVRGSVTNGYLRLLRYVFFPHGEASIASEAQLSEKLPTFYTSTLLPAKPKLLLRSRAEPAKWWEHIEPGAWQTRPLPKIISTYFGDAGSFGWDSHGDYVVVQGFAWLPRKPELSPLPNKVAYAYLAVLNSSLFSTLLAASSNNVSGGQWNLSKKFVDTIAIPGLLDQEAAPELISELAEMGQRMAAGVSLDRQAAEELVRRAYGLDGA
jgi:adenine-specific DNA-methyltransferase